MTIHERKRSETILYNIEGVKLTVFIDYKDKTVSFIDKEGEINSFIFAHRTRDYLGGWVKIFNALETVTREADKKLKEQEQIEEGEFLETLIHWSEIKDTTPPQEGDK